MKDCKGADSCPAPVDDATPSADCKLLTQYSSLCLDMPDMNDCAAFKPFCAGVGSSTSFCVMGDGMDMGGMTNGTSTATPTPTPTPTSAAAGGFAWFATVFSVALCALVLV
jgi:hypothetical protein